MAPVNALEWATLAWGAVLGVGLWLLVGSIPRFGPPRLYERIAPQLQDVSEQARADVRRRRTEPSGLLAEALRPILEVLLRLLRRFGPADAEIDRRLRAAGYERAVERQRRRTAVTMLLAAAMAVLAAVVLWGVFRSSVALALALLCFVSILLIPELLLRRRIAARRRQIEQELPAVLELISLAVTAGESVRNAIERLAEHSSGAVGASLRSATNAARTGVPLASALAAAGHAVDVPSYARFNEQLLAALERGAPVAEVLRAQAGDARELDRRRLLEEAGRREILMMFPLVFVILPLSVAFAVFPGVFVLEAGLL